MPAIRPDPALPALRALLTPPFDRAAWETGASPRLHLRIANAPPATTRDEALAEIERFLARIDGVGPAYCAAVRDRETLWAETEILFTDDAGRRCLIPVAIVSRVRGGLFEDLRLHLDPSPVPIERVFG